MQKKTITAPLIRRLLALFYDVLLLLGVLFAVSAIAVAINKGEAVTNIAYYLCLALTAFIFYGWFWTHGGQTLGMRTWKIKIIGDNEDKISWKQSVIRFITATATLLPALWVLKVAIVAMLDANIARYWVYVAVIPAGLALYWFIFDKVALHSKLSATRLISLKENNKAKESS